MSKTSVYHSDHLRVTCYDSDHPRLIVSFDHWRQHRDGFPPENPSKFFAGNGLAYMTIYSARNDWFLTPDLADMRMALADFTKGFEHVTAIGYSMGGYGALLLARESRANQVVLVSPQSSIFPETAPFETRYLSEAAWLDAADDTVAEHPRKGLRGCLLFDPSDRIDRKHSIRITGLFPNIAPVPLAFGGHPAMQAIAGAKMYRMVQQELLRRRIRPAEFLRIHKQARRQSPYYRDRLGRYLAERDLRTAK